MYGRHPVQQWSSRFNSGKLKAFSAAPRLLYPSHYTGEKGYISDTEATPAIASFDVKEEL
jgi:collagen beta-1,O-galactosyltransferase